jgi:hypothetical protein
MAAGGGLTFPLPFLFLRRAFTMDNRRHSAGKGDAPRQVDPKKWADNWDRIFGKKKPKKESVAKKPKKA